MADEQVEETVIDVEDLVLGRVASTIAKRVLSGEQVIVVNADKAIIVGNPENIKKEYLERIKRGDRFRGPFMPKYPSAVFRRTVRGMLPWKKKRGRDAFKNLRVFSGMPEELSAKSIKSGKSLKDIRSKYLRLSDVCRHMGARI